MPKISTDKKLIEQFLNRGVEQIYPSKEELRKKLMSGERIKAYQGFDPTGPYLHIGHAMGIRALRILQQLGHEVIFLVGDFTAMIGDPDKESTRKILTNDQIQKNMAGWKKQAEQIIDFRSKNPVRFERNSKWLSKLNLKEMLNLMSRTTVQQMIERDLFQKRLQNNNPIGLHEFMYPLMQAYDNISMNIDLEIGGTDQTFNMLVGRQLMKNMLDKEKFVRTNEMMEAPEGRTMSKTKGNGINLSDSSQDIYGKAMSYPDELVTKGLRLLTDVPREQILDIQNKMNDGANPMEYKKLMAYEITKILKGEKEAKKAEEHFERTVQQGEITGEDTVPANIKGQMSIFMFLKKVLENKESSSQIRRVIKQGGVEINSKKVIQPDVVIDFKEGDLIKFGKRTYFKIE